MTDAPGVAVADLRFEHHRDPLGVGEPRPRLSWTAPTSIPGWRQAAYEIAAD
jgi:alpha-L-rhamnosidase